QGLGAHLLETAMMALRQEDSGAIIFGEVKPQNVPSRRVFESLDFELEEQGGGLSIAVCSDRDSWMNASIPGLLLKLLAAGHRCIWSHDAALLPPADLCFYLSYGKIVNREILNKYTHNLVVHASDLPEGKGWSPLTWQI